jgi:hypothetical protein
MTWTIQRQQKDRKIILEAVADHETWIWDFFWDTQFLQYQRPSKITTHDTHNIE